MKKYYLAVLVLITLFALAPVASAMLASVIANVNGCTLNEAEAHRCISHGRDYGETLYEMGMSFWLAIFTVPLAEFACVAWIVALVVHVLVRRRRRSRAGGRAGGQAGPGGRPGREVAR